MAEHIARVLYYFGIHLLYASAVWCGAWILTSTVRASATTKYWIWVATSVNFILPLGAVADKVWAEDLSWARPIGIIGDAGASIAQNTRLGVWLGSIWLVGATLMAIRLTLRLRADRRTAHATCQSINQVTSAILTHGVPVRFAAGRQGPAVDGVLRPRISLPRGIDGLLTKHELNAVLIHELTHARRRDNLIRLIHEIVLCALWFHPLVWITCSRLALYRELSCDDSVIASARGRDLVSALAKLANPEAAFLLQATASSFLTHRLSRLTALPGRAPLAANAALALFFCVVL